MDQEDMKVFNYFKFINYEWGNKNKKFLFTRLLIERFWTHCKFNLDINFNIDQFIENRNSVFCSYLHKTTENGMKPDFYIYEYMINYELEKLYYNNIYPILIFNYNLYSYYKDIKIMDSLFGYKNVINPWIIIYLLKQNGYYIPENIIYNENLYNFVEDITNEGPIFKYETYIDFSELISSIKKTRFHNDDKLNSLFQVRAINYIINGDSLINIFIHELINNLSYIDKKYIKILTNYKIKVFPENEFSSNLNSSRSLININNDNNDNNNDLYQININGKLLVTKKNNKKIIYKLKIENKSILKKNKCSIDLTNKENNTIKLIKKPNYNNKEIYYKFPGLPIIGYKGYIPQMKFFNGISYSKIVKSIFDNGLYLKKVDKKNNNTQINTNKKITNEKIVINCENKPLIKNIIIKKASNNKNNIISSQKDITNKNKGKKSLYKICTENISMKNIFLNNNFENIIKNYFYKINNNYNNPYYIYHSKDFSYLYNKDEDIYEKKQKPKKRETLFQFNNKRLSYLNDSICEYYHRKRIYGNKKEVFPNIFDSLFSIKKIGNGIEVIQHDISELLKPYLLKEDFESLINHTFSNKTKNDLPEN